MVDKQTNWSLQARKTAAAMHAGHSIKIKACSKNVQPHIFFSSSALPAIPSLSLAWRGLSFGQSHRKRSWCWRESVWTKSVVECHASETSCHRSVGQSTTCICGVCDQQTELCSHVIRRNIDTAKIGMKTFLFLLLLPILILLILAVVFV